MNCSELRRWLDEGMPPGRAPRALQHAARCEDCSAVLEAHRQIESILSLDRAPALRDRSRFVERVMERVASAERQANPVQLWPASPVPWWIQAATDPAALLACALIALLALRPGWLSDLTRLLSDRWSVLALSALLPAGSTLGLDRPAVALGLGILGIFALGWASMHLYRWIERVTRRSAGA